MVLTRSQAAETEFSKLLSIYTERTVQKDEVKDILTSFIENVYWGEWHKDERRRLMLTPCRQAHQNRCKDCGTDLSRERKIREKERENDDEGENNGSSDNPFVLFVYGGDFHHTALPLPELRGGTHAHTHGEGELKTSLSTFYWPVDL
eukprot:984535-Lingulodinium_polyedra.AAC.1